MILRVSLPLRGAGDDFFKNLFMLIIRLNKRGVHTGGKINSPGWVVGGSLMGIKAHLAFKLSYFFLLEPGLSLPVVHNEGF